MRIIEQKKDGRKTRHAFFRAAQTALHHQKQQHTEVGCQTAVTAVESASKRVTKGPSKRIRVEDTALSVRATSAKRLRSWCDLSQTVEDLEKKDEQVVAIDYAIDAAAARMGIDPKDAKELYAEQAASNELTNEKRTKGAEKKRREGYKKSCKKTTINTDGTTSTTVQVYSLTGPQYTTKLRRAQELREMDPKDRPMANSQQYAPGETPIKNQATGQDNSIGSAKYKLPGTTENGVFQVRDLTYTVCKAWWKGPKMKPIYFATRAEADAQRAEWIRKKWLPEPPVSNAVSKSTFEAPLAHYLISAQVDDAGGAQEVFRL